MAQGHINGSDPSDESTEVPIANDQDRSSFRIFPGGSEEDEDLDTGEDRDATTAPERVKHEVVIEPTVDAPQIAASGIGNTSDNDFGLTCSKTADYNPTASSETFIQEVHDALENTGFTNIEIIGEGGQGIVFKAFEQEYERSIVIKVPKLKENVTSHDTHLSDVRSSFENERKLTGSATSKDSGLPLVEPLTHGEITIGHQKIPWMGIKFIDGQVLSNIESIDTETFTTQYLKQVCEAVDLLNNGRGKVPGVIHRDLKPGNILVTEDDQIKVLDFGLGLRADESGSIKPELAGTLGYMSPEQCRIGLPEYANVFDEQISQFDKRSDVFALGAMLYEKLTGGRPFTRTEDGESRKFLEVVRDCADPIKEIPFARSVNENANRELSAIAEKALHKDPEKRYESAQAMADDIQRFNEHKPVQAYIEHLKQIGQRAAAYNSAKFFQRNGRRLATSTGIAVGAGILLLATMKLYGEYRSNTLQKEYEKAGVKRSFDKAEEIRELYERAIETASTTPKESRRMIASGIDAAKYDRSPYGASDFDDLERLGGLLLKVDQLENWAHLDNGTERLNKAKYQDLENMTQLAADLKGHSFGLELSGVTDGPNNEQDLLSEIHLRLVMAKAFALYPSPHFRGTKDELHARNLALYQSAEAAGELYEKVRGTRSYAAALLQYSAAQALGLDQFRDVEESLAEFINAFDIESTTDYLDIVAEVTREGVIHSSDHTYPHIPELCRRGLDLNPNSIFLSLKEAIALCSDDNETSAVIGYSKLHALMEVAEDSPEVQIAIARESFELAHRDLLKTKKIDQRAYDMIVAGYNRAKELSIQQEIEAGRSGEDYPLNGLIESLQIRLYVLKMREAILNGEHISDSKFYADLKEQCELILSTHEDNNVHTETTIRARKFLWIANYGLSTNHNNLCEDFLSLLEELKYEDNVIIVDAIGDYARQVGDYLYHGGGGRFEEQKDLGRFVSLYSRATRTYRHMMNTGEYTDPDKNMTEYVHAWIGHYSGEYKNGIEGTIPAAAKPLVPSLHRICAIDYALLGDHEKAEWHLERLKASEDPSLYKPTIETILAAGMSHLGADKYGSYQNLITSVELAQTD